MLLRPLFFTSFLIDDQLADDGLAERGPILMSSASSKTAIAAAHMLARREGVDLVGLTSAGNVEFVEGLGLYGRVVPYEEIGELEREAATYVDFSGNPELRRAVHERFDDDLLYDMAVGVTHWEDLGDHREMPAGTRLLSPRPASPSARRTGSGGARAAGRGGLASVLRLRRRLGSAARRARLRRRRGRLGEVLEGLVTPTQPTSSGSDQGGVINATGVESPASRRRVAIRRPGWTASRGLTTSVPPSAATVASRSGATSARPQKKAGRSAPPRSIAASGSCTASRITSPSRKNA